MQISKFTKVAAAAAVLLSASTASHALLRLTITDGISAASVACTTPLSCSAPGITFITTSDSPGNRELFFSSANWNGWTISGTVGFSDSPGDSGTQTSQLNISALRVTNNTGVNGYLDFSLVGTDYSIPAGNDKFISGTSTISSQSGPLTAADQILTKIYARSDNGDILTDAANLIDDCLATGPAAVTVSRACDMPSQVWTDTDGGSFSMRVFQRVTLTAGASVKADSLMVARAVPEPMTVSLVGAALLGAAVAARRRSNKA